MDGITQGVYEILDNSGFSVDGGDLQASHLLTRDLGMGSMDLVQLGLDLEEAFNVSIPDGEVTGNTTVGELIEYIRSNVVGN